MWGPLSPAALVAKAGYSLAGSVPERKLPAAETTLTASATVNNSRQGDVVLQVRRATVMALVVLGCLAPALAFATGSGVTGVGIGGTLDRARATGWRATRPAGGILRLALPGASPTVDPALVADEENVELAGLLYSGLVRLDPDYRVVPDSAASWTIGRDHRTYTFHLRPGLRFNNGDAVTAYDFRFSINRSLNPALKSPSAPTYLMDIQGAADVLAGKTKSARGIRVLDRFTLQITARWPVPYFLLELTYPTSFALDEKQVIKLGSIENFSWYNDPIGSGPYRMKSWAPGGSMVLVPNQYYQSPRPALREVRVSFDPLGSTNVYQHVSRSFDVASFCLVDHGVRGRPNVQETTMLVMNGIYMNTKHGPFKSALVRRALTLALDRAALVSHALGKSATPVDGFVPSGDGAYDPSLKGLPFDPVAARRALRLAGYLHGKHFPSTTLSYADDPCMPTIGKLANAIVRAWRKTLGINVDTQALTANTLLAEVQSDSLPLYLGSWLADYPDPHDWLSLQWESTALNNDVHYQSSRFDALAETADVTWGSAQRMRLYRKAQQVLVDDAAWIPLYMSHRVVFVRRGVANLSVTGFGLIPRDGSWAEVRVRTGIPPCTLTGCSISVHG